MAESYFGQRGGGRLQDIPIPSGGSNASQILRRNNIGGNAGYTLDSFSGGDYDGGDDSPPSSDDNTGGDSGGGSVPTPGGDTGGSDSGSGDTGGGSGEGDPLVRSFARVGASDRMKAGPTPDSPLAEAVSQAMQHAPESARNFVLSMITQPENKAQAELVRKAGTLIARLPAGDVRRLFTFTGTPSTTAETEYYIRRLEGLAGSEPLAFSGRKLVIITAATGRSFDPLRSEASRKLEVRDASVATILQELFTGRGETPELSTLKSATVQVLAQSDSRVWFHAEDSTELAHAAPQTGVLSEGGGAANSAVGGSSADPIAIVLGKTTIVRSDETTLQTLQMPDGTRDALQLTFDQIEKAALDNPSATPLDCIAAIAHPNVLVAAVRDSEEASRVLSSLKLNPWYNKSASYLVMLDGETGTEILSF